MEIIQKLPSAEEMKCEIALSALAKKKKRARDKEIADILHGIDDRLLLIIGPCSADDSKAAMEYAIRLSKIARAVREHICIIMRVFTAKPRSASCGYLGLVHEPDGLLKARRMHRDISEYTGLPTADELLYPSLLPYYEDLVSYFTIGARSAENQEHRLVASGLALPVGLKNPTSGDMATLHNSVEAAKAPHDFIFDGQLVRTTGNPLAHRVLRGGGSPNYYAADLKLLGHMGYDDMVIDTNHDNSNKNFQKQPEIAMDVLNNRHLIKGLMIESYLIEGAAKPGLQAFGQSITDPCLGIDATEKLIYEIADCLSKFMAI